jgi:DNA (cytosine-5)-methyltransferase 1
MRQREFNFSRAKGPAARPPTVRVHLESDEIIVDNFAGGGGASSGLGIALGRDPFVAINHDASAIAMHKANHPTTKHYITDVWDVDPVEATEGRPVALAWFSPDCTHFSKARGGKPRSQRIRGLAWIAVKWGKAVAPRVICLENVEELTTWGPLHERHTHGCTLRKSRKRKKLGMVPCLKRCTFHQPIRERAGETWREFLAELRAIGYVVEWKLLKACDYGAPTTRRRLFLIARRDGKPIVWPQPTHGPDRAAPFRTAAECIDWSVPCPSIFARKKILKPKTEARIARGVRVYVMDALRPFIVPTNHGGYTASGAARADLRIHDVDAPMPTITGSRRGAHAIVVPTLLKAKTYGGGGNNAMSADQPIGAITASKRGEYAVAAAYMIHRSNGERPGQLPRIYNAENPIGTIVSQGQKHAVCVAFLNKHQGGHESSSGGQAATRPLDTITAQRNKSVTVAHLMKYQGTSTGSAADEPAPTITAGTRTDAKRGTGGKLAVVETRLERPEMVAAFLSRYNGKSTGQSAGSPIGTIDTTDRYALVTVTIDGEDYVIVDIGMRMLTPRELYACQGFEQSYIIDPIGPRSKKLTKTEQIRMVGNSVPPPIVAAIARAQLEAA